MESHQVKNAQNCPTDGAQLVRNRSLKTKQLVRSQAIRESQSPPRSLTPAAVSANSREADETTSQLEHPYAHKDQDVGGAGGAKMHSVEIQITTGCDTDPPHQPGNGQRSRSARWLGHDCQLLSHPLVTCVCRCPFCSGIIRPEYRCLGKQDSGIACSDDCPDCADCDHTGGAGDGIVKSASEDLGIDTNIYCKCPENKDKPKNILIKSDSMEERLELSGPELISFIKDTLNKSSKDRIALLKIEKELHSLVNDKGRTQVRFPPMHSYGRMLVHRCASLFQLTHILDSQNKSVMVSKQGTSGGRIPCTAFKQWCTSQLSPDHGQDSIQAKYILKRLGSGSQEGSAAPTVARSLAQRQRDYDTLRTRIFNSEEESSWPWLTGPVKLLTPDPARNKLLKVQSLEGTSEPPGRERVVSKSHSFAGYPPESQESQQRQLSRQGDLASSSWRLSPSSSGYKTLSLRSTDSVTPSPTGGVSPEPNPVPGLNLSETAPPPGLTLHDMNSALVPASGLATAGLAAMPGLDMASMPGLTLAEMAPVAHTQLLLHPQTGRPLMNPDGSLYQYDPNNPPVLYGEAADVNQIQQIDQNNEKRRGRLEKQHSFIENEYEAVGQESPENSYQLSLSCDTYTHDQVQNPMEHISGPIKMAYDITNPLTNPIAVAQDLEANHAQSYDGLANNRTQSLDSSQRQDSLQLDPTQYSTPIGYVHAYRPDVEVELPNQHTQLSYAQQNIHGAAKTMPLQAIQDPNLRAMQLQGMVYPTHIPQSYAYPNHCGMDANAYATSVYQPVATSIDEQQKQLAQSDNTFRIDASYTYSAPIEAYACGNQCLNGCTMNPSHHRSVYATPTVDSQGAVYPLTNIMIPQQYPITQFQQLQWQPNIQPILTPLTSTTPLQKPLPSPNLYLPPTEIPLYQPHIYQQGQIYPLIQYQLPYLPQTYPICPNLYPVEQRKFDSARNTPQIEMDNKNVSYNKDNKVHYQMNAEVKEGMSKDLALQIQKLNERFATLNAEDKVESQRNFRGERFDYRKRNNGNGILGCYPANSGLNMNFGRPMTEDSQLTTAARAIANSIRQAQSRNNYQPNTYQRTQEQLNRTEGQPQQLHQAYQQPYNHYKHENYQKNPNYQKFENSQKPDQFHQKSENYQKPDQFHHKSENYQKPDQFHQKSENYQKPDQFHQKSENYQKPESYQKSEIYQRPENNQKPESYQKPENQQKPENFPKPGNSQKSESFQQKTDNSQKAENYQKPDRPENNQTPESYRKPESYQKPENYQISENYQKPENYQSSFQRQDSYQNGRYRYQRPYEPERRVEDRLTEAERSFVHRDRNFNSGRFDSARNRTGSPMMPFNFRQPYVFRQMAPNTWCRRTPPSPLHPGYGPARRPPPDTRNTRR